MAIGRRGLLTMISVAVGLIAAGTAAWLVQRKYVPPISADDPRQPDFLNWRG